MKGPLQTRLRAFCPVLRILYGQDSYSPQVIGSEQQHGMRRFSLRKSKATALLHPFGTRLDRVNGMAKLGGYVAIAPEADSARSEALQNLSPICEAVD
jgi:hypothetical protein